MPSPMGYYDENYMRDLLAQQMNSANGVGSGSVMPSIYDGQVGQNHVQIYGSGPQLNQQQAIDSLNDSELTQFANRIGATPPQQYAAMNPGATPQQLSDYQSLYNGFQHGTLGGGAFGIRNWMHDHPVGVAAAFVALAAGGAALSPAAAGAGGAAGTGGTAAGTGATAGATGATTGAAGATGAGAGAAGATSAAELATLPTITVTGTTGAGLTAGQIAAAGAGVGGLGSIYSGAANNGYTTAAGNTGSTPTNYGQNGGLNTTSDPAATFGRGIGTGSNAGDLGASGTIQGGAGSPGVGGMPSAAGNTGWTDWLQNNAGSLAGLAAGYFGSGGTKNQTATTTNEPPAYLRPYLNQAAQGATALFGAGGPQYFPGQTLAPQSQASQDALSGIIARAQAGSPLTTGAQNYVTNGLQQPISSNLGNVTNPYSSAVTSGTQAQNPYASATNPFGGATNPYLDATYNHALQQAQSGVESQYQRAGRNIGASEPVMGDIASNLATQIYAPAYENDRNRQLQYQTQLNDIGSGAFENQQGRQLQAGLQGQNIGAQGFENAQQRGLSDVTSQRGFMDSLLGYASPLAAQDYMNLSQLQGAGANQDLYNQQTIDDARARYDYGQNQPGQTVDDYIRRLTGLQGTNGVQTTSQPLYQNQWANALGTSMLFQQLQNGWK